jgi:acetyl esterase
MIAGMPLNPAIQQILAMIARANRPSYHAITPQEARASYERSALILEIPPAPMFAVEDVDVPTRDGATIRMRLYHPTEPNWAEPAPALVYFNFGGFNVGSI